VQSGTGILAHCPIPGNHVNTQLDMAHGSGVGVVDVVPVKQGNSICTGFDLSVGGVGGAGHVHVETLQNNPISHLSLATDQLYEQNDPWQGSGVIDLQSKLTMVELSGFSGGLRGILPLHSHPLGQFSINNHSHFSSIDEYVHA
jgi:hypothetical protein